MENMVFVVRAAVEEDIPQIQEITREAFKAYMEGAGINGTIPALQECFPLLDSIMEEVFTSNQPQRIEGMSGLCFVKNISRRKLRV